MINMKQELMVFGIYILLSIYSVYFKIFEKDSVHKNSKKAKNANNRNVKKNTKVVKCNETYGLKLFKLIDSIDNNKFLEKLLNINPNIVDQKDKNGNTPLMLSIIHNKDGLLVSKLLSYTSDINTKNNNGDNCLMLAVKNGNKKLVDLILQTNINVNSQNNDYESPLFSAIAKGRSDLVHSLMNKNINLNIRNKNKKIPIEEALISENMDLIKYLIENGATTLVKDINDEYIIFQLISHPTFLNDIIEIECKSPNKRNLILTLRNKKGNTLFMEFCRRGYVKLAKFMIKNKIDLNCVNHGENALTLAIRENQIEIVKLLLTFRNIDIHHITNDNKTPLRIAIENENISIIKMLINHSGHLLLKNENEVLLKNAINTSNSEVIKLLLDININIDVKFGSEKNTPLIYSIKKILKDINIDTSEDEMAGLKTHSNLYYNDLYSYNDKMDEDRMSSVSSNSSVTTLATNKNISIADNNYYSRVFFNMENEEDSDSNHEPNSPYIYDSDDTLSDNDSINEKNSGNENENENESESDNSFNKDESNALDKKNLINTDIPILNHKASFDNHYKVVDTSIAVDESYCDIIKSLLQYRAKVNLTNSYKDTALILACRYGLKNVVEILLNESRQLDLDIGINMLDRYGNTALHNACKKNYTSIVKLLLQHESINVNIQNQNGNSALMIAVYENNLEIIHELLKCKNINIDSLNVQLETPLIAACRMNNYKIAKILLDNKAIINKRYDLNGETAIFHSIRNNNKKLTSLLLENEASVSFKNKNGKSPLNIAKEYKYKSIVSLLFSHFKNLSSLKNKGSTLSLNENMMRNEDKKSFFNKAHSRNASLNISNLSNNGSLSVINELKGNNSSLLKVNHNRNNSVTFNRNIINPPTLVPMTTTTTTTTSSYPNNKHSRHESFNEGVTTNANTIGRFNSHTRHKSCNPELLTSKTNRNEKFNKTDYKKDENEKHESAGDKGKVTFSNSISSSSVPVSNNKSPKLSTQNEVSPSRSKKGFYDSRIRRSRSYSSSLLESSSELHKKISTFSLKKDFHATKPSSSSSSSSKLFEEPKNNDEVDSDTEFTTNLLIEKAKEKIQNEINASIAAYSLTSSNNTKSIKRYKSQNNLKGESKPDDYLKPLKTACYNKNFEEIKKFYENLVQEKGNIYQLPDELFQQVKSCINDEKEREKVTKKIKDFNKNRPSSMTTLSIDMFAFTLLYFSDNSEAIETMLKYGLNPNMQNNAMYTLLILACKKSQPKSALVLLDYNANPNYQNKYDETALILACKKGLVEVIEKLIQCHANVNLRNDKGETALIMACWKKNISIVKKLLETDVDINMKNNLEESPLYLSCLQNSTDIAEILLKHGADVNAPNKNNETPIMVARKNNNTKLIELLLKYGAKED